MNYPAIDPVAIALGPFQVHWYGLMYVVGFVGAWWLGRQRAERFGLTHDDVGDLLFYAAIGVVAGGAWAMRSSTAWASGWPTRCGYSACGTVA